MRVRACSLWLVLALVACSGTERSTTGVLSADAIQERVASAHFRRHITQSPRTLDPSLNFDIPGQFVIDDLFEGLVRLDPQGSIVPAVAQRWDISEDGLQWRFFLREARWSNGQPVTAGDFVYAWRRAVDPATASEVAQQLAPIGMASEIAAGKAKPEQLQARAIDDHTLEVTLAAPTPYFLYLLTNCLLMPLHEQTIKQFGDTWTQAGHLVGNGAFVLKSRTLNGPIELARNPHYVDQAAVRIASVTYLPIPDNSAATARYLAGDLDATDSFALDDAGWLRESLGDELRLAPYVGTVLLAMHTARAPFDNKKLRLAMTMAIDRELLARQLLRGLFLPAYGLVAPLPEYPPVLPSWAKMSDAERLAEARRLYAEAGYDKDHPLVVELSYPTTNADTRRVIEALAAMWRLNLGADIRLANEEWRVHMQNRGIGKLRLFWFGWIGDYPDPLTFLSLPLTSSGQNHGRYANPAYDVEVNAAMNATDLASRNQHYVAAEKILNDDAVFVPVYFYQSRHLLRSYVQGWKDNAMDRHLSRDLFLAQIKP